MIKKILKKKHRGDMAVEAMILTPLMFVTYLILLYFFFMSLTYVSYNNLANKLAQNMNMRQSGYQKAIDTSSIPPKILTYSVSEKSVISESQYLNPNNITFKYGTTEEKAGLYSAMKEHQNQFLIPFNQVTRVDLQSSRPIKLQEGRKMAGNVITVNVYFRTMVFGGVQDGKVNSLLPTIKATGYNTIN